MFHHSFLGAKQKNNKNGGGLTMVTVYPLKNHLKKGVFALVDLAISPNPI